MTIIKIIAGISVLTLAACTPARKEPVILSFQSAEASSEPQWVYSPEPDAEIEAEELAAPEIIPFQQAEIDDIEPEAIEEQPEQEPEIEEIPDVKEGVVEENQPLGPIIEEALLSEDENTTIEEDVPLIQQDENWE